MSKVVSNLRPAGWKGMQSGNFRCFDQTHVRHLLAAGTQASTLGIAILDRQTRFEFVNAALSRETRATVDSHYGKTSSEIVGELAGQIEPAYENVMRSGKAESVLLRGHVRETPEYGYWLDHCFPIFDHTGRVQQLGLFVVNVTAEKATREILSTLTTDPKLLGAEAAGILEKFDEAIGLFHCSLRISLEELACPFTEASRKIDRFRSSMQRLDDDITEMRELIYACISQFSIPAC